MNRRQHELGNDFADMPEAVFQNALLGGHLRTWIQMLQAATPARPEKPAAWLSAERARLQDPAQSGQFERGLSAVRGELDDFPGQGAFDENRLAVAVRHAAAFLVEGFDYCLHVMFLAAAESKSATNASLRV